MLVAVTGGVGSGKSAVAAILAARGAVIVDADAIAREVVEPNTPGLAGVVSAFGARILAADGTLDRAQLAQIVFADETARERLNAIVHPLIAARSEAIMQAAEPGAIVVYDVPLLAETGRGDKFEVVIVIEAPLELRLDRLERRGLPRDQALARIATQASDEQRRAIADELIVNDGSPTELEGAVDAVWVRLTAKERDYRGQGPIG
jgi:dephospho-CoA kinase